INDMNTQIATAAEAQSAVAEEINRNVTTISVIADTTSNDAQQTSQISEELVRLAAELNRLVGQFKLKGRATDEAGPSARLFSLHGTPRPFLIWDSQPMS